MKVKKIGLALALSTFLPLSSAHAEEGRDSGSICTSKKCITLAEAGIRLSTGSSVSGRWYITPEILKEIEGAISSLPFGKRKIEDMALGDYKTFSKVEKVDKKLLNEIMKDYKKILSETKNNFFEDKVEIFAISSKDKTFLLPKFFDLTDKRKALILIHEGIVRSKNLDYRLALMFDGEFLDYLDRESIPNYSPLDFYKVLSQVIGNNDEQLSSIVKYVESKLNRRMLLSDLTDAIESPGKSHPSFYWIYGEGPMSKIGPKAIIRNQALISDYEKIFGASSVYLFKRKLSNKYDRNAVEKLCSEVPHQNGVMDSVLIESSDWGALRFSPCLVLSEGKWGYEWNEVLEVHFTNLNE